MCCLIGKMKIQENREVLHFMGFVLLLSTIVATGVECKLEEQPFLASLIDSGVINQEMAELLRENCMYEIIHAQKTLQALEFHFVGKKSIKLCEYDTVNTFFPQVNQIFIDCIGGKDLVLHAAEENCSDSWYLRFLNKIHRFSTRRAIAQTFGETPAPSSSSPPFLPQPTANGQGSSTIASDTQSSNYKNINRTVVIAVAVTASVTFVFALPLYLFCCRCCVAGSGGKNDVRSPRVDEEKIRNQSFSNKLENNMINGSLFMESRSLSNLKVYMPAGTTAVGASNFVDNSSQVPPRVPGTLELPPLKPPPRMDPLKPPPHNATPPPPPAPVPPPAPPVKSSTAAPPPAPPPPIPHGAKAGPQPPPPPPPPRSGGVPPPRPPPVGLKPPRHVLPGPRNPSSSAEEREAGTHKAKLKPFFWDKVLANPDHSMVWHRIKSGSFQFDEEMIESLFGYAPSANNKNGANKESSSHDGLPHYLQLLDPKKSQNLSIMLKALNVTTEEVCDALQEGKELPSELIQALLRMAPTADEELKLQLYKGELSQLFPAERFLKVLVDIPYAFKRLESLFFMCTLQEETSTLRDSFDVMEAACTELRKSRLFFKLLEAVLKTGNRMNDGTFRGGAQAFKLDTLLKLSDVKGTDGKTTLLHFVVQEIIRSEGVKAARAAKEDDSSQASDEHLRGLGLQVVSGLGNELENVKRAAALDADSITATVAKLGQALEKARNFLNSDMKNVPEESGFHQILRSFVRNAQVDVMWAREEEKRIKMLVKSTGDFFHGNSGKDEGLRLFVIVRDFLVVLDKVCKEVQNAQRKSIGVSKKEDVVAATPDPRQMIPVDHRQRLLRLLPIGE